MSKTDIGYLLLNIYNLYGENGKKAVFSRFDLKQTFYGYRS